MKTNKMAVDELYWNSIDFGSDESIPRHGGSGTKATGNNKHYVDPWDLENYAYIRQHLDSIDLSSDPSSEPLDSGNSASFYYVPGSTQKNNKSPDSTPQFDSLTMTVADHGTPNYAAIDDVKPYVRSGGNRHHHQETVYGYGYRYGYNGNQHPSNRAPRRDVKRFDSFDSETEESPYEEGNRDSSLLYIYETRARCRRIAMPTNEDPRDRSFSFSYGEFGYDPYKPENHSKLDDIKSRRGFSMPIYDDVRMGSRKPNHFGLSNYGHLKIDYSYSWSTLDKYIYN